MHKNQKGFLIALCLCMLSVAGILGVYQYRKGQSAEPKKEAPKETAQAEETQEPKKEAANSRGTVAQADTKDKKEEAKIETEEDLKEIGEAQLAQTPADEKPEGEKPEGEQTEQPAEEAVPEEQQEEPSQETGADAKRDKFAFAEDSKILWPVKGDVILNYSMDKSIYFSTLNQYKYHPAIVISANVGDEVKCAARGEVTDITVDEETGTTITMNLGNGYTAVYGQLKEVSAEEGDTVEAGELLGYVSEPTKYYTLEGSNLYFQLLKNEEPMNPMDYLE